MLASITWDRPLVGVDSVVKSVAEVQRLLEAGAEVDKATPFGTPLSQAAQQGHENCAALLWAAGAKDVR